MRAVITSLIMLVAASALAEPPPSKTDGNKLQVIAMLAPVKQETELDAAHKHFTEAVSDIKTIAKSQGIATEKITSGYYASAMTPMAYGVGSPCESDGKMDFDPASTAKGTGKSKDVKPKGPRFTFGGQITIPVENEEQGLMLVEALAGKGYMVTFSNNAGYRADYQE